jgi:plastocyanin
MRFSVAAAAVTLLSVASVQAADHLVKVGSNGTLTFDPSEVDGAVVGDTVSFQFQAKNHSLTQSTFAAPCTKLVGGADSGFMPVQNGSATIPQFTFNITNATVPLWFFCAQTTPVSHCGSGMVFALNPTAAKTFSQFQTAAKATGSSSNGTSTSGSNSTSTKSGSATSGTATSPAASTTQSSAAFKLSGGAAGIMTVAALFLGITL